MLYDTHAHIDLEFFGDAYKDVIAESLQANVLINIIGTHRKTSEDAVRIASEYPHGVWAVVGMHPDETARETFDMDFYLKLAQNPKVVGIGECGLDYYRIPDGKSIDQIRALQRPAFEAQLNLARQLKKALVIHCRPTKDTTNAYEDLFAILKKEKPERFVVHSFTGTWDICQEFLKLGAHISLNGIITFDKTGTLKEVAANIPLDRLVLETDAPFLAPLPHRGKQNKPIYVEYVAQYIAEIRGISMEEVADATTKNGKELFGTDTSL